MTIRGSTNLDDHNLLYVGNDGGIITRALLEFEDLPSACGTVQSAILYMYYEGSMSPALSPARTLKVHKVCRETCKHNI